MVNCTKIFGAFVWSLLTKEEVKIADITKTNLGALIQHDYPLKVSFSEALSTDTE